MVKLTHIYTRGGDKGKTSLGDGRRVAKHDPRVAAYGTVDEANAAIGVARGHAKGKAAAMLTRIQNDLFDLGADLCFPEDRDDRPSLRIQPSQTKRLEQEIDAMNAEMKPLASFILPGGSAASAALHLARAIVRRAEREMTALAETAPVNAEAIRYINRLSDHLFVLARYLNGKGKRDPLWKPGATR